jgi:peptidylprolyl isomerase
MLGFLINHSKGDFMETVQNGLYISVEYKVTLEDGEVFDASEGQPLEVLMGDGQVIPGFESALMGMKLNEKKTFTLTPDDAYGDRDDELIHIFSRAEIPPEMDPVEGQAIALSTEDGHDIPAYIVEVSDERVVVDMNHPLAGETLTFEIEVVGISKTATQEHQGCGCGCDDSGCGTGGCSC